MSSELNFGRLLRRATMYGADEAIVDLDRQRRFSYSEHLDRVARLAAVLTNLDLRPANNQPVGNVAVLTGASHVYVELWRASLAGAAMINPINTRLAPAEIIDILRDAGSNAIVVDDTHARLIDELRPQLPELHTVLLDDTDGSDATVPHDHCLSTLIDEQQSCELPPEPNPTDPAVLLYTGGTTGRGKGVVLCQRAITLTALRMQPTVDLGSTQSYLSFMPMFHIGASSSWSFYLPQGGKTVIMPSFEPAAVNATIASEQITAIGAVPTMLTMLLDDPQFNPDTFSTLQLIVYGGAPMPPPVLEKLSAVAPHVGLHQAYGMTEACGVATALTRADHREGGTKLGSVGRPATGIDLELRSPATGERTPRGDVGEIWLSCDSLMTEYWNQPETTAAALIDGWYRTGDAGYLDDEGYLYLADRVKDMIVSGGENVYSLEVESAITSLPEVDAAAVVGLEDPVWGERVHAVVTADPALVTEELLDRHVRRRIAGYKVPRSWTISTEPLPLSATGKVLKRKLRNEHSR